MVWTLATPCSWCVTPIVQPNTTLFARWYTSATWPIVSRSMPDSRSSSAKSAASTCRW